MRISTEYPMTHDSEFLWGLFRIILETRVWWNVSFCWSCFAHSETLYDLSCWLTFTKCWFSLPEKAPQFGSGCGPEDVPIRETPYKVSSHRTRRLAPCLKFVRCGWAAIDRIGRNRRSGAPFHSILSNNRSLQDRSEIIYHVQWKDWQVSDSSFLWSCR